MSWGAGKVRQHCDDGEVLDLGYEETLQSGTDLREQAVDLIAGPCDLAGRVLLVADDDLKVGQGIGIGAAPSSAWGIDRAASAIR
jgi:hypothetical protein